MPDKLDGSLEDVFAAMDAAGGQSDDADPEASAVAAAALDIAALKASLSSVASLEGTADDQQWKSAFGSSAEITDVVAGDHSDDADGFEALGTF